MHRLAAIAVWIVLVALAFGPLAPPARADEGAWLWRLIVGEWESIDPLIVAEFQLMGIWPLLCALLTRAHWRHRPVPAWPFLLGSFALGCFVLLPWFGTPRHGGFELPERSRTGGIAAVVLGLVGAGLIAWGLLAGDPATLATAVRTESFMWAMTWDFGAFALLFAATVLTADERPVRWLVLVPILGPAAWLAWHHLGPE